MTTTKPQPRRDAVVWEPYPELEAEPKEMMQMSPIAFLRDMLITTLTPGRSFLNTPRFWRRGKSLSTMALRNRDRAGRRPT